MLKCSKERKPYVILALTVFLFIVCLCVLKPSITIAEHYTVFSRVKPEILQSAQVYGSIPSYILPDISPIEFACYPFIANLCFCAIGVFFITLFAFLIPNIFVAFSLGAITILIYTLFCINLSRTQYIWIPVVWPVIVQFFVLFTEITTKAAVKQTKLINTVKLFGYDINKFPNSIPFIKNIIRQPKKTEITLCYFKLRMSQVYLEETSPNDLVYEVNKVFQTVVDGILKHSGIIDKTSNDIIVGYWMNKNHSTDALNAVLEINSRLQSENIRLSCGIHTENTVFAILGSENFANYTVLGSVTDVASRLENACVFNGTPMLLSSSTLANLKDKIIATHKGSISIHGLTSQIDFYEFVRFIKND